MTGHDSHQELTTTQRRTIVAIIWVALNMAAALVILKALGLTDRSIFWARTGAAMEKLAATQCGLFLVIVDSLISTVIMVVGWVVVRAIRAVRNRRMRAA